MSQTSVKETDNEDDKSIGTKKTISNTALFIRSIVDTEGVFESPIDLTLTETQKLETAPIEWHNFENDPKKIKITNTGHTIILSAKWKQERPYICGGPFLGKYVFSQLHMHWGAHAMEGSEHTIDGGHMPGEIHAVFFKSAYLTQESALKEKDGIVVLVYMLKLQDGDNYDFCPLIDALPEIQHTQSATKLKPFNICLLVKQFSNDYFLYWGSINTTNCTHYVLWTITRVPIGIGLDQLDSFRYLLDESGENLLLRNFRDVQPRSGRAIFHVNPSPHQISTLLPEFKGGTCVLRVEVPEINFAKLAYKSSDKSTQKAKSIRKFFTNMKWFRNND